MSVKIINYKAGNAPSVLHALNSLNIKAEFANHGTDLAGATHIILPGVGSADATMSSLKEQGFLGELEEFVLGKRVRFLGICVGLQILLEHSEEGNIKTLGWINGTVERFDNAKVRVPQMGWNKVNIKKSSINEEIEDYFYFVNSYYAKPTNKEDVWGSATYSHEFCAAINHKNIFGTQFHVEKSGPAGLNLLKKFCESKGM